MNYEPTEAEFRGLLRVLGEFPLSWKLTDQIARRILRHYEPRMCEQRCDGSGDLAWVSVIGQHFKSNARCPGCANCQGMQDGGLARKSESTTESDARTAQAAAQVAPITIALDDRTLRGMMAAIMVHGAWGDTPGVADQVSRVLAAIDKEMQK